MPVFMPAAGTYPSGQVVTMSEASAGTTIYYTTDGSTPTTGSQISTGQIQLTTSTTLRAIAAGGGYDSSEAAAASYEISIPGSHSSGGGGGGSFGGWGLIVLGLLATRRGLARAWSNTGSCRASRAWHT
jgi:MYXO-CTERM domain-containing protein